MTTANEIINGVESWHDAKKLAIVTIGVSASGKSTWANEMVNAGTGIIEINRDAIRVELLHEKNGMQFSWKNWKWKWESEVTEIHRKKIESAAHDTNCHTVIISDTNLNKPHLDQLVVFLKEHNFNIEFKIFEVSYEEAVRRDAERHNGVGSHVIANIS